MNVICLEEQAFFELVETCVARLNESSNSIPLSKWINTEEAMALLNVRSKTTLQKLRDEGKIAFTQPQKRIILYDRTSIDAYLDAHAQSTF